MRNRLEDCKCIDLVQEKDPRGSLTYIYGGRHIPFQINRVFYIYDVPSGEDRGAHAHKECWQLIVAASGSIDVYLNDGVAEKTVTLNRPYMGLIVPPGIWAHTNNYTTGAVCLVLASHDYAENDYMRNFNDYLSYLEGIK